MRLSVATAVTRRSLPWRVPRVTAAMWERV